MKPPTDKSLLLQSFLDVGDFCKYIATYRSEDKSYLAGLGINHAALEFLIEAIDMLAYSIEQKIIDEKLETEKALALEKAKKSRKIIDIREYLRGVKL